MPAIPLPLISVSGDPYQLGYQHGAACQPIIRRTLRARVAIAARATGMAPRDIVRSSLRYLEPVRTRFPQLIEEVQGIADGAEIEFSEAFFIQVATELTFRPDGCTTLALHTLDGEWLIAQNWDMPRDVLGTHIVLHLRPAGGPEALMFTYAGVVGYLGINAHGVCHVANQLLTPDWRVGVTHYFVKRRFLELASVDDCLDEVRAIPISSSANYILGDTMRAVVVEWTPSGLATFTGHRLGHTNHLLDPALCHLERYLQQLPDSLDRLERLSGLLWDASGSIQTMAGILSDHAGYPASICRHGGTGDLHTLASVMFEPSRKCMHVAYGNPCTTRYDTYGVDGTIRTGSARQHAG